MARFVIVGRQDCRNLGHACYIADMLKDYLADFDYRKIALPGLEWTKYVREKNSLFDWNHWKSPLIYKEVSISGSLPFYLGSVDEFWEYIYDYYGLEYILSKNQIENIRQDNLQYYSAQKRKKDLDENMDLKDLRRICIAGADKKSLSLMIPEVIKSHEAYGKDGLVLYLYTRHEFENFGELEEEPDLYDESLTFHIYVQAIEFLEDYIQFIDVIIIFGNRLYYNTSTDFDRFLEAELDVMLEYSHIINKDAKNDLRIIVARPPTCLNATILTQQLVNLNPHNIVAVTSDIGFEALHMVSREANIPVSNLSSPPVYGFVDINHLIDIGHIVERVEYNRVTKRVAQKDVILQLRPLVYKTYNMGDIWRKIGTQKKLIEDSSQRFSYYGIVRATCELLRLWYAHQPSEIICSAGILTKGLFGITKPLVFSQPVTVVNGVWTPFTKIPKSEDLINVEDLVPLSIRILEKLEHRQQITGRTKPMKRNQDSRFLLGLQDDVLEENIL